MAVQIIKDGFGENTVVFIPINDWNKITQKHEDLRNLVNLSPSPKIKLSDLAGKLSNQTALKMQQSIIENRNE
ncbi:MAG: hypothetical protein RLZZ175_1545 [Bacteroidota bacterium]|jgi:hypothetical protein